MGMDRRGFLKIAGLGALGVAGLPAVRAVAQGVQASTSPGPDAQTAKRWAMVVDLRQECPDGCRDCIAACHTSHNVPDFGNPKDEVKWIWRTEYERAFPGDHQPYPPPATHGREALVFCNHCDQPPCVRVCPTKATYRRPDGIVAMDFHRCIGCRFCMAGCPYGSRSFNWRDPRAGLPAKLPNPGFPTRMRGVVEKCNFCSERLVKGLPPACVEACKEKMLAYGDLEDANSEVRRLLHEHFTIRRKPNLGTQPQIYYIV